MLVSPVQSGFAISVPWFREVAIQHSSMLPSSGHLVARETLPLTMESRFPSGTEMSFWVRCQCNRHVNNAGIMASSITTVPPARAEESVTLGESTIAHAPRENPQARLWIDVEDLFEYALANARPSGIQRLAFEIYCDLQRRPDMQGRVHFLRHDNVRNSFRIVSWADIDKLFNNLASASSQAQPVTPQPPLNGQILPHSRSRQWTRRLVYRLPLSLRVHVIDALVAGSAAARAIGCLFVALAREGTRWIVGKLRGPGGPGMSASADSRTMPQRSAPASDPPLDFMALSKAGDILLTAGSPWGHPDYAVLIRAQRERGLVFALLVYDLIPIRRPEWCNRGLVRVFTAWLDGVLPIADAIFAISRATAADVEAYMCGRGMRPARPVMPIPIGTGFSGPAAAPATGAERPLPRPGSYALAVSTIEARKNHLLLFRVWRRMLEEMRPADVPTLVFAGRIGWLVDDLMKQIANTAYLDGKLVVIENPTDAELVSLYQGCLFTMFPSFFEGWGLPVAESLAFGKPCVTSNRTSLPEVGGKLTRRFDPDNLNEAYAMIRQTVEDRPGLARWEAQIRREFRPVPWSDTVDTLLNGLGLPQGLALGQVLPLRRESRAS